MRTLLEEEIVKARGVMKTAAPDKDVLLEPLKKATYELAKSSDILDQTTMAHDKITSTFLKEVEKCNDVDDGTEGSERKTFKERTQCN